MGGREGGGTIDRRRLNPLWAKAPVVLLRFPGLLAALGGGALLLSLAGASYPLFMSATSSDAVRQEISTGVVTRYGAGIAYIALDQPLDARTPSGADRRVQQDKLFTERVSTTPYRAEIT